MEVKRVKDNKSIPQKIYSHKEQIVFIVIKTLLSSTSEELCKNKNYWK